MDGDIAALRADTSAFDDLGVETILDHYTEIINGLDRPPVIIGHSFGGAFTQVLIDRGLGAAGVAMTQRRSRASSSCRCPSSAPGSRSSRTH
jgi:hypothetical protein